ncbi:MAG TPA: twin-arginine translocase TatA/TatE family subunit [Nitrolancea sp.]|nr:twin-arginine translocase TatA/TatE family subunit [Nitrolancea sp.]
MSFFGMGPTEFLVIAVIAFVIFGPEKFAELAGTVGKYVREIRSMTGGITGEFQDAMSEFQQVTGELKGEFQQVSGEIQDTTRSLVTAADVRPVLTRAMSNPASPPAYVRAPTATTAAKPTKQNPLADLGGLPEATPEPDLLVTTETETSEPRPDEPAA